MPRLGASFSRAHRRGGAVHTTRPVALEDIKPNQAGEVVRAVKVSGEHLQYPDGLAATIRNGAVSGESPWRIEVHVIPRAQVREPGVFARRIAPRRIPGLLPSSEKQTLTCPESIDDAKRVPFRYGPRVRPWPPGWVLEPRVGSALTCRVAPMPPAPMAAVMR